MSFGEQGGGTLLAEYRRILDTYAEAGGNVIDTAVTYRGGRSEAILGELLTGNRDRRALREGLYVGISDAPAWVVSRANTLAEWRGWTPSAGLQVPYNLLQRAIERELLPMAEAFEMTVAAWSPLAHGVLTGKYLPAPAAVADDPAEGSTEPRVVRTVCEVAADLVLTPAQVAIAWTRTRSRAVHPILGARTASQLTETLKVLDVTLPGDAVARLERAPASRSVSPATSSPRRAPAPSALSSGNNRPLVRFLCPIRAPVGGR